MKRIIEIGGRFVFLVLTQALVLNHIEVGGGSLIMIYPLFVLLLPVEMNVFMMLFLSFLLGLSVDAMSDTFGLHASAALGMAYFRPVIFKLFASRDGYEGLVETNIHVMGIAWFIKTFGVLLLIHHFWFFLLELFKLNELLFVAQKTLISLPMSFVICILLQYLFIRKQAQEA